MCVCLFLHLCITIVYLSTPLEISVSVFLSVVFLFTFLLILYISWTCSLSPGFFSNSLFSFNLEKDWESYLYSVLYLTSSVTTANSQTSCISNSSLVKEDRNPPSTFLPELLWEGYSGMATAMLVSLLRLPIYQAPYIHHYIHHFLIPKICYLEGLNHYIPPFYWKGDWDPTLSYVLPKIAEQNLNSNLCLCHGIYIKFW